MGGARQGILRLVVGGLFVPVVYTIDSERGIVFTTVTGKVSVGEMLEHFKQLAADPAYHPHFDGLSDQAAAEMFEASGEDLRRLALALPLVAPARRAIIVNSDLHFAFGRMVEMNRSTAGVETRVFRTREDAAAWLGINEGR